MDSEAISQTRRQPRGAWAARRYDGSHNGEPCRLPGRICEATKVNDLTNHIEAIAGVAKWQTHRT